MRKTYFGFLSILMGLSSIGCGVFKSSLTNLASNTILPASTAILTPMIDGTKISSVSKNSVTISGTCSASDGNVLISGAVTAVVNCLANGTWSTTFNFSGVPDGTVVVQATQHSVKGVSTPATRLLIKDTTFCDNPVNSGASPFAGGAGIAGNPYLICTVTQLEQLPTYLGADLQMRNDIDVGGVGDWPQVGTFTGVFDGNGFVIKNLTYLSNDDYIGFISYLSGTVMNLGVVNVNLSTYCHTGGIAGVVNPGGVVQNSYSTGTMIEDGDSDGGLVGWNDGTISNSYSTVNITENGDVYVGGLVGYSDGTVTQSYATGVVTLVGATDAGGLVGHSDGTVSNSYATGTVTGDVASNNLGGLVGNSTVSIQDSYSTGAVSGPASVGGLVGANSGTVTASYWDMTTSGNLTSAGGVGLSDSQMKQQSNFIGWDFSTPVWMFCSSLQPYPVASWQ